jgi:hypothetical protein
MFATYILTIKLFFLVIISYLYQLRKTLAPEEGGDPSKMGRIFLADTDN